MCASAVPSWSFCPQVQTFLSINPVNTLMIIGKSFSAQQNKNPPEAVSNPGAGNFFHTHTKY
jgi:hypothetical protein